LGGEEGRGKLR